MAGEKTWRSRIQGARAYPRHAAIGIFLATELQLASECHGLLAVHHDAVALALGQQHQHGGRRQVIGFAIGMLAQAHWLRRQQKLAGGGTLLRDDMADQPHALAVGSAQRVRPAKPARADGAGEELVEGDGLCVAGPTGQRERREAGCERSAVQWIEERKDAK
jgi:hypothetical protein